MTARRKILSRALVLAAITALAGAAVANASSRTHHEKHIIGRVASLSATGFTINGKVLSATSAQLAGLAEGQCVEVKTRLGQGALNVVRISREDRCAPLTTAPATTTTPATVSSDDPAQHDVGDDHGGLPANASAQPLVADDRGNGSDDPVNHDVTDDHGRHGNHG
ncbi:MAG: hypothetical protein QOH15_1609 [Gaiellales bacterium]|jgi:hypothetical protein|nr:hypothetical protein [Gaiellales bacterium]